MTVAYRGHEHVVASRYAELAELRARELATLSKARSVYARRVGRIAAGAVASVGAFAVFGGAMRAIAASHGWFVNGDAVDGTLTYALLLTWPAAAVAYVAGRICARARIDATLERSLARTGDWACDLRRLEEATLTADVGARAVAVERPSASLPLIAASFLAPLTIHYLFMFAITGGQVAARGFDEWIAASVLIVGHAHLVLAICSWLFAGKLARRETGVPSDYSWAKAFGFTVLAGAIPGGILYLIPPVIVAVTGLAFIPLMYFVIDRRMFAERMVLDGIDL
jgi:hypothetical protein